MTTFEIIHLAAVAAGQEEYDPDVPFFRGFGMTERAEYCHDVAWTCNDGEFSTIVHARSAIEASWLAEGDYGLTDCSVERCPEWDNKEFTPRSAIDDGWWWGCGNCGHKIDSDGCSRHNNVEPIYTPYNVYCCEECAP